VSIRLRLAVWYGALFGLILVIVAVLSYAFHARGHYEDLDRILVTTASHTAAEVESSDLPPLLTESSGGLGVTLRVYGADGTLRLASPQASKLPPINPAAVMTAPAGPAFDGVAGLVPHHIFSPQGPDGGAFGLVEFGGQRWRIYVRPVERHGALVGYVEALVPLGQLDRAMALFRTILATMGLSGIAAALIGGWFVAGGALRPVTRIIDTTRSIAQSRNFSQRVEASSRRDEVARLIETVNLMLANLEGAYRAQQRFVADASHELRAPLTAIQGNLELLQAHPDMTVAEREEALVEARREADRLTHLVADLLVLARADAGVQLNRRSVDLDVVVLEAFRTGRQLARGQVLELESVEPARVIGDPDRLSQLILILLDNAVRYTPPPGRISLALRCVDHVAEISVRDAGIGIAPEDLPRVFERFYRADPARSRDGGGTGLGLPIARWITEQHGGELRLDSEFGKGTVAAVRLPVIS
jgi:signal transduction histidine kinase